ncbi:hypothetical protein Agabi119p4_7825 [Agaricus bisporus var. burnettii]|uniref:Uncharacterized protein n=1 Tax=Agaricus bisporus var. burnettii TaxID=192524 RepID=A0A8H7C7U5_AGABI|nr:hypothetical protein Agabi119p4_7825 [Agaricus bisporus var. burnettii]
MLLIELVARPSFSWDCSGYKPMVFHKGFSSVIQDPDDECHSSSDNMVWKSSESSFLTGIESSVDPLEKLVHLETEAVDELLNLPLQSFSMWFRMLSSAPDFRDKRNGLASWSLQKGRVYASNRSRSVI